MPKLRLVDSWAGVRTGFHKDPVTGANTIYTEQDCTAILERNKLAQSEGVQDNEMGRCLASIPVTTFSDWLDEDGMNYQTWNTLDWGMKKKWIARKLNDPAYAYLKTTTKRIFAR